MDNPQVKEICAVVAQDFPSAATSDLPVWRVGKNHYARILALVNTAPITADPVRLSLGVHEDANVNVEVALRL
jgi:hypothetical protein